jgi:hypothetical protein
MYNFFWWYENILYLCQDLLQQLLLNQDKTLRVQFPQRKPLGIAATAKGFFLFPKL